MPLARRALRPYPVAVTRTARWTIAGVALTVLVAAAIGVLIAYRAPLIEAAGERFLAARGYSGIDLAVERVGLTSAALAVRSPTPGLPSIERIEVRFRPLEILGGRIREVVVAGLRFDLDIDNPPAIGELGGGSGGDEAAPRVVLEDAKATIRGLAPVPLEVAADGVLDLGAAPRRAEIALRLTTQEPGLEAAVRIVVESGASTHALWLAEPLRLSVAELGIVRRLGIDGGWMSRLQAPMRLTVAGAKDRPAARATPAEGGWKLDAAVTAEASSGAMSARLDARASTDLDQQFRPVAGEVRLQEGALHIPPVETSGLGGRLRFDDGAWSASLQARLRHDVAEPAVAPFDLSIDATATPDRIEASGSARWHENAMVPFKARYKLPSGDLDATFGPAAFVFGEGFQPRDLSRLAPEVAATGTLEADARVAWRQGGEPKVQARLAVREMSLQTPDFAVSGLNGSVAATQVDPLRTAPGQIVTADRVVAGVPLEEVLVEFRIADATLRIAEATATLAGGTVALGETVLDPAASEHAFDLRLRNLSLAQVLDSLGVDGLEGEGTLSGRLPLRLGPKGLGVAGGELADTGAGVIRLDVGAARQMLEGQGEQVALVVDALKNFHYDRLQLGIERPAAEDLTVKVRMTGQNPDVLEGHPFDFNISLSGNPDPILDAIKEGRRLSGDLLKGTFGQ